MIGNAKWNLGSLSGPDYSVITYYEAERGTEVYDGHATEWIGKVGLMYASDYGFASSYGRRLYSCFHDSLRYDVDEECLDNNWLHISDNLNNRWTLTSRYANYAEMIYVDYSGFVGRVPTYITELAVYPSLFLKSTVKIISGEGTESSPFTLSL